MSFVALTNSIRERGEQETRISDQILFIWSDVAVVSSAASEPLLTRVGRVELSDDESREPGARRHQQDLRHRSRARAARRDARRLGVDSLAAAEVLVEMEISSAGSFRWMSCAGSIRPTRSRRSPPSSNPSPHRAVEAGIVIDARRFVRPARRPPPSRTTTISRTSSSRCGSGDDLVYSCALWDRR